MGKENFKEVRNNLTKFEGLFPYLELIAKSNKIKNPFNYKVIHAYWIGNNLLLNVKTEDLIKEVIIKKFGKFLTKDNLENVIQKIPKDAKPHHSFHVFYIGTVTGKIEKTLENKNLCMISWGRIKGIRDKFFLVERQPLIIENNKLKLGNFKEEKIKTYLEINGAKINPIKDSKIGGFVSIHWDFAVQILDKNDLKNLQYWTNYHLNLQKYVSCSSG